MSTVYDMITVQMRDVRVGDRLNRTDALRPHLPQNTPGRTVVANPVDNGHGITLSARLDNGSAVEAMTDYMITVHRPVSVEEMLRRADDAERAAADRPVRCLGSFRG